PGTVLAHLARRLGLHGLGPAERFRGFAHAEDPGRDPAHHRVCGHVPRDDGVSADHRVVADLDAAQDAGAVSDPDVRADFNIALVYPLDPDRAFDLDDAMVEVDEHRPIGDHALLADPHVLVGGDRALLAEHGLVPD